MVEESESYDDMELDPPPKLTFDELRAQVLREPKLATKRLDLLKTLYYYSKDTKKHSRIIKVLFWALIVPLLQDKSNRTALYGLKTLNQLIINESSHEHIIKIGLPHRLASTDAVRKMITKAAKKKAETYDTHLVEEKVDSLSTDHQKKIYEIIESKQNPVKILVNIILKNDEKDQSIAIMQEATKAIKNLAKTEDVIHMLMKDDSLLEIINEKFSLMDAQSQEQILETVSATCAATEPKGREYRTEFVKDPNFKDILFSQVKSISRAVTFQTLRICRQLAKDKENLEILNEDLGLSHELIYAFQWLDAMINQEGSEEKKDAGGNLKDQKGQPNHLNRIDTQGANSIRNPAESKDLAASQTDQTVSDLIFREISKAFEYILKYYDQHKRKIDELNAKNGDGQE